MGGRLFGAWVYGLPALIYPVEVGAKATDYFPPRAFLVEGSKGADISGMLSRRYSEALLAMKEPPLWKQAGHGGQTETYRLLWLPTWGNPIAVRIENVGQMVALNEVRLDGEGGYEIGDISMIKQMVLSQSQWHGLTGRLEAMDYWDMPTCIDDLGADGEHCVLEGVKGGLYHVVDRRSPGPGKYRDLCHYMLSLAEPAADQPVRASTRRLLCLSGLTVAVVLICVFGIALRRRRHHPIHLRREW